MALLQQVITKYCYIFVICLIYYLVVEFSIFLRDGSLENNMKKIAFNLQNAASKPDGRLTFL